MVHYKSLVIALLLALFTSQAVALQNVHPLSKLQPEIQKIISTFEAGSTSLSFSYIMKVYLAVDIMESEMGLIHPAHPEQDSLLFLQQPIPCQERLRDIVQGFKSEDWVDNFQTLSEHMKNLQKFCTNRDFKHGQEKSQVDSYLQGQVNGFDNKCALCVVITRVMENYISYHAKDVSNFVQKQFCRLFDGVTQPTCEAFIHYAGPTIIRSFLNKQTSDVICLKIGFCINPDCKIAQNIATKLQFQQWEDQKPAPWQWLVHIFVDKFGDGHLSPFDLDNDTFSDVSTFRGYNWRGVDCNQFSSKIYPGRKVGSKLLDHDCNGIYGVNQKLQSFEDMYCSEEKTKSKRLGLVVIGDSAGAHFSIPEKYFNASMIQKGTYNDLLVRVADQLDLPHYSGYTGHVNRESPSDKTHSIYKYLRNWNMCNNNDYQNVGVNGGTAGNTQGNIKALKRDPENDYPLLMFMELIGNDVCKKSFDSMTKPQQFKVEIIKLFNWLDNTVPKGSHLMMFGLADGDILYDNLHDQIHPLNVTYSKVYDFLNCLNISPCWGWLNSNQTVRKFATERAKNLSKVYQQVIDEYGSNYKNFDMVYYDFPTMEILQRKVMQGGDPKDLIERCDGFHPNGQFNSYLADWIWSKIQTDHPSWVGEKNPFNAKIQEAFGLKDIN